MLARVCVLLLVSPFSAIRSTLDEVDADLGGELAINKNASFAQLVGSTSGRTPECLITSGWEPRTHACCYQSVCEENAGALHYQGSNDCCNSVEKRKTMSLKASYEVTMPPVPVAAHLKCKFEAGVLVEYTGDWSSAGAKSITFSGSIEVGAVLGVNLGVVNVKGELSFKLEGSFSVSCPQGCTNFLALFKALVVTTLLDYTKTNYFADLLTKKLPDKFEQVQRAIADNIFTQEQQEEFGDNSLVFDISWDASVEAAVAGTVDVNVDQMGVKFTVAKKATAHSTLTVNPRGRSPPFVYNSMQFVVQTILGQSRPALHGGTLDAKAYCTDGSNEFAFEVSLTRDHNTDAAATTDDWTEAVHAVIYGGEFKIDQDEEAALTPGGTGVQTRSRSGAVWKWDPAMYCRDKDTFDAMRRINAVFGKLLKNRKFVETEMVKVVVPGDHKKTDGNWVEWQGNPTESAAKIFFLRREGLPEAVEVAKNVANAALAFLGIGFDVGMSTFTDIGANYVKNDAKLSDDEVRGRGRSNAVVAPPALDPVPLPPALFPQ